MLQHVDTSFGNVMTAPLTFNVLAANAMYLSAESLA